MNGYRFYGSSLLINYDGGDTFKPVHIRLVDFAICVTRQQYLDNQESMSYSPEDPADQPDHGYLKGLHTLIETFQNIASKKVYVYM